jgi:TPR repeat protein
MKANQLVLTGLFLLSAAVFQLHAQQNEADRKLMAEIRARAEKGDAQSQSALGEAFHFGTLGVTKNYAEAVKWYRKAAEQNLAEAQFNLGSCYAYGQGVTKDEVEALKWFRKAAEQNLAEAQFNLGICYAYGQGVTKDEVEALKWFRKAAEQNLAEAQVNLGFRYANGKGVTKNYAEAVKWFRKAAEQNDARAQFNLSFSYLKGAGVAKDYVEAYKWCLLAAAQDDGNAKVNMTILENKMSQEQTAEGQSWRAISSRARCHPKGVIVPARVLRRRARNLQAPGSSSRKMAISSRMNMWPETEPRCVWSRAPV